MNEDKLLFTVFGTEEGMIVGHIYIDKEGNEYLVLVDSIANNKTRGEKLYKGKIEDGYDLYSTNILSTDRFFKGDNKLLKLFELTMVTKENENGN